MTDLRTAAQEALQALEWSNEYLETMGEKLFPESKKAMPGSTTWHVQKAITALRAALAEPVKFKCTVVDDVHPNGVPLSQWGKQPVQEPDLSRCPQCGGIADNGHDRNIPPNPYLCTKCMAEPVADQTLDDAMQQPRAMARAYESGYKAGVAHEREACAKVCEEPGWNAANWCAKAIRARGNT